MTDEEVDHALSALVDELTQLTEFFSTLEKIAQVIRSAYSDDTSKLDSPNFLVDFKTSVFDRMIERIGELSHAPIATKHKTFTALRENVFVEKKSGIAYLVQFFNSLRQHNILPESLAEGLFSQVASLQTARYDAHQLSITIVNDGKIENLSVMRDMCAVAEEIKVRLPEVVTSGNPDHINEPAPVSLTEADSTTYGEKLANVVRYPATTLVLIFLSTMAASGSLLFFLQLTSSLPLETWHIVVGSVFLAGLVTVFINQRHPNKHFRTAFYVCIFAGSTPNMYLFALLLIDPQKAVQLATWLSPQTTFMIILCAPIALIIEGVTNIIREKTMGRSAGD
ncbi:hypothetical protein [Halocynthiibacter sp.]|uniref:hypothetical protein n=1 Tax=Halocynthiibacter sp. TaxID=1979210 RepID=UPI003C3AB708